MAASRTPISIVKVRPAEMRRPLLDNPGKGCATFQRFNGDPINPGEKWSEEGPLAFPRPKFKIAPRYLPSSVSYCRWFWEVLEPREGIFDWTMIEGALKAAKARGQTLQVRLMPFGASGQPQLPEWYARKYATRTGSKPERRYVFLEPDYSKEEYFRTWGKVIREFGRRFDGHPDLESVDLAFIGPWGEGAGDMPRRFVERFVELYVKCHKKTALLTNIDGYQFPAGIARGTGWRCDCFGDLRTKGQMYVPGAPGWNHTYDAYPRDVAKAGAQDAWKTQPVVFETCSTPLTWEKRNYDLDMIIRQGLKSHVSVFMPKSCPIPKAYMRPLAEFCDRIGYRFVLRQALYETPVRRNGRLSLKLWIENTGVAPIYRPYDLAVRMKSARAAAAVVIQRDIRGWLPGDVWLEKRIEVPARLGPGPVELWAGLVDPKSLGPKVKFANETANSAGWLPLGRFRVS